MHTLYKFRTDNRIMILTREHLYNWNTGLFWYLRKLRNFFFASHDRNKPWYKVIFPKPRNCFIVGNTPFNEHLLLHSPITHGYIGFMNKAPALIQIDYAPSFQCIKRLVKRRHIERAFLPNGVNERLSAQFGKRIILCLAC